jgi:Glycogen recognition site of AMP-activated protein kinase
MNGKRKVISLAHSNGKRSVSVSKGSIKIKFATILPIQLQIKNIMKTLAPIQSKPIIPSLFQIASHIEDFVRSPNSKSPATLEPSGFADLMLHREKLEKALKNAKRENDAFDASRKFSKNPAKQATRSAASQNFDDDNAGKLSSPSLIELKPTEFHLEAPFAESVKLAADFTEWEKFPLDMIKSEDGVWYTTVPLPPGHYSYRFIVDGEWCDDPRPILRLHNNPFGRANAVMDVD